MKKIVFLFIVILIMGLKSYSQVNFNSQKQCIGDTTLFSINDTTGIDSVYWNFGDTTTLSDSSTLFPDASYQYPTAGNYTVKLYFYKTGIIDSVVKAIAIFNLPLVDLGSDQTACLGSTITLKTSNSFASYFWNDSSTNATLDVSTSRIYSLIATDTNYCSNYDAVKVTFSGPTLNLDSLKQTCAGMSLTLDGGTGYASYSWSTGASTQTISVNKAGTYSLTVSDNSGCKATDTILVKEVAGPTFNGYSQTPVSTIADGYATLYASAGTGSLIYSLLQKATWQSSNQFSNLSEGYYTAIVKDDNSCTDSMQIQILTNKDPVIPSDGFSPNQDGVNENWTISKIEIYPKAIVKVYDRWGKLVFESKGNYKAWNGTDTKGFVSSGTYFYFIDLQNGNKPQVGYITVIR